MGGLVALVIVMLLFVNAETPAFGFSAENGENIRATNLLVAIWFAIFSIPTFLWVKDKPISQKISLSLIRSSYGQIKNTFKEIRKLF